MRVTVESWSRKYDPLKKEIKRAATRLGRFLRIQGAKIDIILVDDRFMKKNVLSFPTPKGFPRPANGEKYLGEIYLNPGYIKTDPFFHDSRFKFQDKVNFMLVHGVLHTLGYDHKRKSDIIRMEKKEQQCLQNLSSGSTSGPTLLKRRSPR